MAQVLIIEDDHRIRPLLMRSLRLGYAVAPRRPGCRGSPAVETKPDLVILDLGLPDVDGTQVLSMLRAVSDVPVIVASARDDDPSLISCLDAGADDYVVKPYTTAQLEARIRAVMRRTAGNATQRRNLIVGGLEIEVAARTATLDGVPIDLSPREFDLLRLAESAGDVVTKKELLVDVWHQAWGGSDKTVDVHLSWLRRKLGESASEPRYLHTVRGVGVRLSAPGGGHRETQPDRDRCGRGDDGAAGDAGADGRPAARLRARGPPGQAALEVQATETVVSGRETTTATWRCTSTGSTATRTHTTVLYPDGTGDRATPGEDSRVAEARATGRARVDDVSGGAEILVPVSLGGSSTAARARRSSGSSCASPACLRSAPCAPTWCSRGWVWCCWPERLCSPTGLAARSCSRSGAWRLRPAARRPEPARAGPTGGSARGARTRRAMNRLVGRIELLLERERAAVSDLSHRLRTPITALRLRIDGLADTGDRERLAGDLDQLQVMVDHVVSEARRSEREGLVPIGRGRGAQERAHFWEPLAEDQGREFSSRVEVPGQVSGSRRRAGPRRPPRRSA